MRTNELIIMHNFFKDMNILKKIGLSLFVAMFLIYLVLSVKFILS